MKILIAEDDGPSRLILERMLVGWGHEVIVTEDGNQAWDAIAKDAPDIAILDWMMSGLDGVGLCQKIRNAENLPYIYIILLTAKEQADDMLIAFDAGVDDYVIKPFNKDLLRSRVSVGERIVKYDKELTQKNEQLRQHGDEMEELAQGRSEQLVHAERMATVGLLSAGIAHEINNPTAFISGNIQTLERFWNDIEPALQQDAETCESLTDKIDFILEEMPKTIEGIRSGVNRISKIVNGLKAFCRKDHGDMAVCNIDICIEHSLELCRNALKYHVTVEEKLAENLPQVKADPQQIEQVFVNLFTNAAHAIGEKDGTLTIETKLADDSVIIQVGDTGHGIPKEKLDDIWQPFFTTKPVGSGTGLGLSTVLGIVKNHNGTIKVENKQTSGALFTISLPILSEGDKSES